MLQLRPNCEHCDKDLPADSTEAMICTYECTFCKNCVEQVLKNVCPNCGGGFCQRPIRPLTERRAGLSRLHHPASDVRILTKYSETQLRAFADEFCRILPEKR